MSTKIGGGSCPISITAAGRLVVVPSSTPIPILLLLPIKLRPPLLSPTCTQYLLFPIGFGLSSSRRRPISPIKASSSSSSPQTSSSSSSSSSGLEEDQQEETSSIELLKSHIYDVLQGTNRGIFGIPSERKSEIECLVKQLESLNPTPDPSLHLEKVGGCWKLVYSTITILGSKRTKLGLRDFITLGDFFQIIDVPQGKAVNVIKFNARGFKSLSGELTIEASFKVSSRSRVDIQYSISKITPDQLMNVFQKNYSLLLGIFNPDGWLEITYVDATMRIGRDDKGNIFILERSEENP